MARGNASGEFEAAKIRIPADASSIFDDGGRSASVPKTRDVIFAARRKVG